MKYLIDFIDVKNVEEAKIYQHLKCSEDEGKILQYMTKKYVSGVEDIIVSDMLQDIFGEDNYVYLDYLDTTKSALELGWIVQQSFQPLKISDMSKLELLNSAVSLTVSFLKLLEEGNSELVLPEIKAYEDHLEYLQDQFLRIELYQKMSTIRHNVHENALGINRVRNKLELLEKRIQARLNVTKQEVVLEKFFKQKRFEDKEQIIFLALLKEEYSAGDNNLREMNALIDLISLDEYERIKNRSLLEDGSKLIEGELIDYEEMLNPFGGISRAFYIVDDVLQEIIHPQKKKKVRKLKLDMVIKEQDIFELIDPHTSMEDVVLHPKTEETLNSLMRQVDKEVVLRLQEWGIKEKRSGIDARVMFYGHPGTGKTMTAYSLAKSLKRQVLAFDCSKILSMYVGESEKNVRKIFDTYYDLTQKTKPEPI